MKRDSAQPARPRGRPRSFDREAALERAMEVFWRQGYESTSIQDLTKAMGINPPSLYAAFGDKERLYLECLERYMACRKESMACAFDEEPTARAAVERMLKEAAIGLAEPGHPKGCMLTSAAATCSEASAQLQATVTARRSAGKARIKARIDRGLAEGELPPGTDTAALTDFYSTVMTGMSMQARDGASRKSLMTTVDAAMRAWPEAPKRPSKRSARALASA